MNNPGSIKLVQQVIVLATGAPGSVDIRDYLLDLYGENGDWGQVAAVIDAYMNSLLAQNAEGIPGMIRVLAMNAFGLQLNLAEAQTVTDDLMAAGVESWSGLFTYLLESIDGDLATTWGNRADSATLFTDLLAETGKSADYEGSQVANAAREWVSGIGESAESMAAANKAASALIARFIDGKVQGTAIDGYVAGAEIFIDVNNNGEHDEGEPITISDANGNFIFEGDLPAGILIGSGGVDIATGQPFNGVMTAPSGAVMLSPLTTLVQQMMDGQPGVSQSQIEENLFRVLNLPSIDLSSYDPIQSGLAQGASRADQVTAAQVQSLTSQLVNVMNVSAVVVNKLQPNSGTAQNNTVTSLISAINQAVTDNQTIDLSRSATVSNIILGAVQNSGAIDGTTTPAQLLNINNLTNKAGQAIEGVNTKTRESVEALSQNSSTNIVDALSDVFKLQTLTITSVVPTLFAAENDADLDNVVDQFNGSNLDQEVADVEAGNLDADTPANQGNVTRPDTAPLPNASPPRLALVEDTGVSSSDNITSNSEVLVNGLASGGVWEYSVDGSTVWTRGSGSSFSVEEDGSYVVSVRQIDPALGTSAATSLSFTLDTTAPEGLSPVLEADSGQNSDRITNDGTVVVNHLQSNASWQYSLNGGSNWIDGSGNSFEVTGDGSKSVLVRQTDLAGNDSSPRSLVFTLDQTTPDAVSLSLLNNSGDTSDTLTNDGTVVLTGLDSGASWEYRLDGSSIWLSGSGSTLTVDGASHSGSDGTRSVSVRQIDVAGNTSQPQQLEFSLDTVAPDAVSLSLVNNTGNGSDSITNDGSVAITGLENGAVWEYRIGSNGDWVSASGSTLTVDGANNEGVDGPQTVYVRQFDAAGNNSAESSLEFTLDTTAPGSIGYVYFSNTGDGSDQITNIGQINVNGMEAGVTLEYSLDNGQSWQQGNVSETFCGTVALAYGNVELTGDGQKNVLIRQVDAAGNASVESSLSFTLDQTAPSEPSLSFTDTGSSSSDGITNNGVVTVTGLEEGATWEYSLTGGSNWSDGSGSSFNISEAASYDLRVRQSDVAGNTSDSDGSLVLTLDLNAAEGELSLANDTGSSSTDLITNDLTINATGLEQGAEWQYRVGTDAEWVSGGTGSTLQLASADAAAADSNRTIYVRQVDVAGNTSEESELNFTLDTTAPDSIGYVYFANTGSGSDLITSSGQVSANSMEVGAILEYSLDNGQSWQQGNVSETFCGTVAQAYGNFELTGDGEKNVLIRQVDTAGNASAESSLTFTLDQTVPVEPTLSFTDTGSSSSDGITNNGVVTVTGLEEGATWEYSLTGGSNWNDGSGSSFSISEAASYDLRVRQSDVAGNTSDSSGSLVLTLDLNAAEGELSLANDTGSSSTDMITSDFTIVATGLEQGGEWQYRMSSDAEWVSAGTGSNLELSPADIYRPGADKTVYVRQIDVAGNISEESELSFNFDSISPDAPSLALDSNTGSSSDTLTSIGEVVVSGLEEDATWEYNLDGGTVWTPGDGSLIVVPGANDDGTDGLKTVYVRQIDVAGNESDSSSFTFTLDTVAPAAASLSLVNDSGVVSIDNYTNDGRIAVTGIESNATWEYRIGTAAAWVAGGTDYSIDVQGADNGGSDGTKLVFVRQIDAAGNQSSSALLNFTLDTVAPPAFSEDTVYITFSGISSSDNITREGTVYVSGIEGSGLIQFSLDAGSNWISAPIYSGSGHISIEQDGSYDVVVRQIDRAGNISDPTQFSFTLDTKADAPSLSFTDTGSSSTDSVTNNGVVTVTGLENNATWEYSLDGGSHWSDGSGSQFTVSSAGNYDLRVRQTDVVGNESDSSGSLAFTLDLSAAEGELALANDSGSSSTDLITNDISIVATGLEDSAVWEYRIGTDAEWASGGTGSTLQLASEDAAAADGNKTIYVRQVDVAGNISEESDLTFTLDTTAPSTPSFARLTTDSGASSSDKISNQGEITIYGLESDATVQYSIDEGSTWSNGTVSSVSTNGGFVGEGRFTAPVEGGQDILIRQVDVAGNISESYSLTVNFDTEVATPQVELVVDSGGLSSDWISNEGLVNVNGLEDGATWEYSLTGGSNWNAGSGSSFSISEAASYDLRVRQTDLAGNQSDSSDSLAFTLDTSAAEGDLSLANDSGRSSTDLITNNFSIDASGLENGAVWEYRMSMDSSVEWVSAGTGSSLQLLSADTGAADGAKTIYVRQVDVAGNISEEASLTFTLDTSAPLAPVVGYTDTGSSSTDRITNNGVFSVTGLENDATWEFSLDGGDHWNDGSGSQFTVSTAGNYDLKVRQSDAAGNLSNDSSGSVLLTLDVSAAEGLLSLTNDSGRSSSDRITNDFSITATGLEDGAEWQYRMNLQDDWVSGGIGSELVVSAEHRYQAGEEKTIYVRQVDVAGNISDERALSFTLDDSQPEVVGAVTIEDTGASSVDKLTNNGLVTVSGLEANATLEYSLDEGSTWSAGVVTATSAEVGSFTLTGDDLKEVLVRQVDAAGNASETTSFSFTLDTTAPSSPTVTLVNDTDISNDLITEDGTVTVTGLESDASWQYNLSSSATSANWSNGSGSSLELTGNGEKTLYVRQVDVAGNASAAQLLTFTIDVDDVAPLFVQTPSAPASDSISIESNEAVTAGLYDVTTNLLIGSTVEIEANTVGFITVAAQGDITQAYIKITDGEGNFTVAAVTGSLNYDNYPIGTSDVRVTLGTASADTITGIDDTLNLIFGFAGGDTLTGGREMYGYADQIHGGDGNDIFHGADGYADIFYGGTGDDTYTLDNGGDQLFEEAGEGYEEIMVNTDGNVKNLPANVESAFYIGGQSAEFIGNDASNTLYGGRLNDKLSGGAGPDTFNGQAGADMIFLGESDNAMDTVLYGGTDHTDHRQFVDLDPILDMDIIHEAQWGDVILLPSGVLTADTIVLSEYLQPIDYDLNPDAHKQVSIVKGEISLDGEKFGKDWQAEDENDYMLQWHQGANIYSIVLKDFGTIAPMLVINPNDSTLTLTDPVNEITGTESADELTGSQTAGALNIINGLGGNDTITGGPGADELYGGEGDDVFKYSTPSQLFSGNNLTDIIDGGGGTNTIVLGVLAPETQSAMTISSGNIWTSGISNVSTIAVVGAYDANISITLNNKAFESGIKNIDLSADTSAVGSNSVDVSVDFSSTNGFTLTGGAGTNVLRGGSGPDVITGGTGADTLVGNSGDDTITGGGGADEINGGSGSDTIDGNDGDDTITGGTGDDIISGGSGIDTYLYDTYIESRVRTTSETAAGFDTVTFTSDDIFRGIDKTVTGAVLASTSSAPSSGTGTALLFWLNDNYETSANNQIGGAMLIDGSGTNDYLVVDWDANGTISNNDLVIKVVGSVESIAVSNGDIVFNVV